MDPGTSLKDLEKKLFQASLQDGILDLQIGCVLLIFALTPLLSEYWGDFWSSAAFLPFWALILLGSRSLRRKLIRPRLGQIEYGPYRRKRLKKLSLSLLVINLVIFVLGLVVFFALDGFQGWLALSALILAGFSLAGYLLDIPRLYLYGLLCGSAPLIGEFLYRNLGCSHHGFPLTFGVLSAALILSGLVMLVRILRKYPLPDAEDLPC